VQEFTAHGSPRRRLRAVSFVASLLLFEAALVVLVGSLVAVVALSGAVSLEIDTRGVFGPLAQTLPVLGLASLVVVGGGGLALAGLGLLHLREWGWVLAMALQGLGLANALFAHLHGDRQYVQLALCSFVVLALNQREVRQAFQVQSEHA
jgi:hypothetical protein